ncbi:conserved Plasmodium protein, unknown function [Plasmodium berghei]|uniref:Kelch domain-containing protein, putative n=2 Tax=Plasmodium berghei TaxID=5821 RepID=A0A509AS09_PLABA|nr:kelch domain-containing protein, putative [Plasmodium berghei ANKA]AAR97885.1 UOS7/S20 [Plasmodium berghei]CXJ18969.1 conserved Plasmodium protein, unknown function [Plasmodium berghei]SCM26461.1 conserved Plasmodium protein, unknown function [Plasmodium berghei]SCN28470.1 conserved Plasmodium protein, unknown function [Plasmodium berghei]SCO62660.1 conserved Plasmodium protein, unknown function [Plasmodium berghei]|eukprot:XP_034424116.1 kelch domain-containing protein, putative [Plasmodium berghei ANKA]
MSDISDFSDIDDFSENGKQNKFLKKKSKKSTSKASDSNKDNTLDKQNSNKIVRSIQSEDKGLLMENSGTIESEKKLNLKTGSKEDNTLYSTNSKSFQNLDNSTKLKDQQQRTDGMNPRVADCVMSPPEFFISHIYHDNKVFMKKYAHSMIEYENEFFIYGGINAKNEYLDEFIKFTYGPNTFTSKKLTENPGKRAYASLTLAYNNENSPYLLLFGGLCGPNILAKDCYMYDIAEDTWSKYSLKLDSVPGARYGHAYTYCPITYATIIWGGLNRNNELLNSGHNFVGGKWSEINNKGTCPSPRAFSSLVWLDRTTKDNVNYSFLYLFGGDLTNRGTPTDELWVYNIKNENWTLIKNSSGEIPCARWKHGSVMVDKNMWISGGLFSGWFSNYTIPDLYVYDVPSNCWFHCQIASKQIHNCYDYGTLNLHSQTKAFFLFGGKNYNNEPISNVCRFAPLCTSVSITMMRNDIKSFNSLILEIKKETEETANNVSEIQEIIHMYSLDIKDFKILFEALTRSIQILKENVEHIDKELSILKENIAANKQNSLENPAIKNENEDPEKIKKTEEAENTKNEIKSEEATCAQ